MRAQFLFVSEFILTVGGNKGGRGSSGSLATVEVVSPDGNPLPNCMKNLNDFPKTIWGAVGTTFGKLQAKLKLHTEGSVSCDTQNIIQLSQRVGSVNHGTCLLKAKLDVHFFFI